MTILSGGQIIDDVHSSLSYCISNNFDDDTGL